MGRVAARHPVLARTLTRRGAVLFGVVLLVLAVGMPRWQVVKEQRSVAALASLPPETPNVLLIILDTVRAASLGLYGYDRPTTPNLERWASRGVTFERAFAPAPWTLPTHASLFTGQWPHELSADWEKI
jgi:hypothetical protein